MSTHTHTHTWIPHGTHTVCHLAPQSCMRETGLGQMQNFSVDQMLRLSLYSSLATVWNLYVSRQILGDVKQEHLKKTKASWFLFLNLWCESHFGEINKQHRRCLETSSAVCYKQSETVRRGFKWSFFPEGRVVPAVKTWKCKAVCCLPRHLL